MVAISGWWKVQKQSRLDTWLEETGARGRGGASVHARIKIHSPEERVWARRGALAEQKGAQGSGEQGGA